MRNIQVVEFGAPYIRDFMVFSAMDVVAKQSYVEQTIESAWGGRITKSIGYVYRDMRLWKRHIAVVSRGTGLEALLSRTANVRSFCDVSVTFVLRVLMNNIITMTS